MSAELDRSLHRLVEGLADQEILAGREFLYAGQSLRADEVADALVPAILCLAQDLSRQVLAQDFGYDFRLGGMAQSDENAFFSMHYYRNPSASEVAFFEVAPFVLQVFECDVLPMQHEVARVFELAARLIEPDFTLQGDTDYQHLLTSVSDGAPRDEGQIMSLISVLVGEDGSRPLPVRENHNK